MQILPWELEHNTIWMINRWGFCLNSRLGGKGGVVSLTPEFVVHTVVVPMFGTSIPVALSAVTVGRYSLKREEET
jgi:hypothetical protein